MGPAVSTPAPACRPHGERTLASGGLEQTDSPGASLAVT